MHRMATLTAQLTFRVARQVYTDLQAIARAERRKMNEVARALLERGMAAYANDKALFEPEGLKMWGRTASGEKGGQIGARQGKPK